MHWMDKHPKCPKCGSTNTEKILEGETTLGECHNCGNKWEVSGWD